MHGSIPAWAGEPIMPNWSPVRSPAGLSPRGRGNLSSSDNMLSNGDRGSIPAWAGEPAYVQTGYPTNARPVYPRVGGGTASERSDNMSGRGLSPRGRGNPTAKGVTISP